MWLYIFARKHLNTYYSHIRYTCTLEHRYCYVYAWVVLTHSAHYIQCSILSTNTVFTDYFIPYHILDDREWSSENYPLFDIIMHSKTIKHIPRSIQLQFMLFPIWHNFGVSKNITNAYRMQCHPPHIMVCMCMDNIRYIYPTHIWSLNWIVIDYVDAYASTPYSLRLWLPRYCAMNLDPLELTHTVYSTQIIISYHI